MIVVMANGCFDVIHPGHVSHLQEAKSMGDYLIVALTMDPYVNKGPHRPIYKWEDRALLLRELRCVDQVVPSATAIDAILKWRPDVYVKGRDYTNAPFSEDVVTACKQIGAEVRFTTSEKLSATDTIAKIIKGDLRVRNHG